jgi:tRNA(Ile)-lysidine synthase
MLTRISEGIKKAQQIYNSQPSTTQNEKDLNLAKVCVAVSGGADSTCLAVALQMLGLNPVAIMVDHQIHTESRQIALNCQERMSRLGIASKILIWTHSSINGSFENKARIARYQLLTEECKRLNAKTLFVGHHLNDQVETFFINLSRGSGIDGLTGMKMLTMKNDIAIVRPMLGITKAEIISFLEKENITWDEDPTNQDTSMQRNSIRNIINSMPNAELINRRIFSAMERLEDAKQIIDKHSEEVFQRLCTNNKEGKVSIEKAKYAQLLMPEKINLINMAIMLVGEKPQKGRFIKLTDLINDIENKGSGQRTLMHTKIHWNDDLIVIQKETTQN